MERTQNIKSNRWLRTLHNREVNTIRIVAIFHLVGLTGLYFLPTRPLFLQLVPFHLWLMGLIAFFTHDSLGSKFFWFAGTIILTGWLIEYAGVHTGYLFGDYTYGQTLGFSIGGIPIIMGINWFVLVYATGISMRKLKIRPLFLRVLAGALLLVVLDILIEPVAVHLDYWQWTYSGLQVQNYACWFAVSAVFLFVFERFKFAGQSMVAPSILICQFIFFAALQ